MSIMNYGSGLEFTLHNGIDTAGKAFFGENNIWELTGSTVAIDSTAVSRSTLPGFKVRWNTSALITIQLYSVLCFQICIKVDNSTSSQVEHI